MATKTGFGRASKEKMVDEVYSHFKDQPNFFITSYMGLTNAELESLRRDLKKTSSQYFVVKNSIFKIVLDKLKLKDSAPLVEGGVGVSLSGPDIISTCKTLVTFKKDHAKFEIKGAVIDGKNFTPDRVKQLAALPPKEVLLAQVVGGIKSPITGFVNVLGGVLRKFVYVVDAIKSKKQL